MIKELFYKLDLIAPALLLLFASVKNIVGKRIYSFSDDILVDFATVQLLLNGIAAYIQVQDGNNLWVYHVNCITTNLIFTLYFARTLAQKRLVYAGFAVFVVAYILLSLYAQAYKNFPSYPLALGSGMIVIYALFFLDEIMTFPPTTDILSLKEFWILAGILAYFGSTFFIFISYNYLSVILGERVSILWQFHNSFLFIGCVLFIVAINCRKWILK